ncbi:hypothetical protein [Flavobacterium frigoris]|uniref:Uncharacterized protein n=1 Tax=Flavobacterium frigoris TaxID=229204 RepID=A0A1H9NSC2_FLAFI|nr:hypothetical protein [Flavobacterium frigoris]SER38812.1 hypothetical protein SAMN05444355_11177 [Flavobacterium frigoris]
MLKNILNLEGAQKLTKNEQKKINGGYVEAEPCPWMQCRNAFGRCTTFQDKCV